ncbi:septum site-determining protein Ssd [Longispora albida]|uniref:septum site-determining protein Ssd n=1 Tax=Longispora albida TaxID=203523 RepID=UPI00035C3554|nr:septum site-determining protein Ssd [Longispora albida]
MEEHRSLIVTADPHLLDELLRLTAAAGILPMVAPDVVAARALWSAAPLVIVGGDQAQAWARARLPRRPRTVLVLTGEPDGQLWQVAEWLGVEHVAALPAAEHWLMQKFEALAAGRPVPVIGVVGGRGGAGASVLAAGLAVTAARQGARALLVDADPLGGGADLVLGWENLDGLRWPELSRAELGKLPAGGRLTVLAQGRDEPVDLTGDLVDAAVRTGQQGCDLMVVDLPRTFDEAARRALEHADRLLLVVPAELRACAAAAQVVLRAGPQRAPMEVVVRLPSPGRLRPKEVARALGLPLAGALRSEPGLAAALEQGTAPASEGRGPLAELCEHLLSGAGKPIWQS